MSSAPHTMPDLSVIICTHNPRRDYLARTLASLRGQALSLDRWELLLVDNASAEPLAEAWDLGWHPQARHVREEELGLTPARLRGIRETMAGLLVFVDDDNELLPDYLDRVLCIAREHPLLGCFGAGRLLPEFEEPPAPDLMPYIGMLALRDEARDQWSNLPEDGCTPWGAGLVVRRAVAEEYTAQMVSAVQRQLLDRKGTQLNSGGDDEFSWVACGLGLGRGVFRKLEVRHLISRARVQRDYLLRLAEGHAFSHALLAHLHSRPVRVPRAQELLGIKHLLGALVQGGLTGFGRAVVLRDKQRTPMDTRGAFAEARIRGLQRFAREFPEAVTGSGQPFNIRRS